MISTSRLKCINKQENQRRKFMCVMNDVAKTQQDLYAGYIDKEKHESAQNCQKNIVSTRKTVVRQRVLRKCMKKQRDEVRRSEGSSMYGRYHGVSVEDISERVDPYIEQHHPRIRRQQKVDRLFKDGYNSGAILDPTTVKSKVKKYFERPLVDLYKCSDKPRKTEDTKRSLPPLGKSFYTGTLDQDDLHADKKHDNVQEDNKTWADGIVETKEKMFISRKVNKFLEEDIPDDLSVSSDFPSSIPYKTNDKRPLTLPPIKIGTDQETNVGPSSRDCITDLLSRINKAKERRERDVKVNKEKRTKRLLADRVQRNQAATFEQHMDSVEYITETDLNDNLAKLNSRPTTRRLEVRKDMVKRAEKDKYLDGGFGKMDSDNANGVRLPPLNLKGLV